MICEKCGGVIEVGMFPFCRGNAADHGKPTLHAIEDSIPGGMTVENGFDEPRTFYSHAEHRRALAERGLEIRARYVPGDKHLTNWAGAMDPQTLENARILVSRQRAVKGRDDGVTLDTLQVTTRALEDSFNVRADA